MKNNYRLFAAAFAALFAIMLLGAGTAQAKGGIAVDRMIIEFAADKRPVENLNVTNQDDKPTKVAVKLTQFVSPGLAGQKEQPAEDLIVAPKIFELAPGETRTVRLVLKTRPEDTTNVYRVSFTPSTPSFFKEEAVGEGKTSIHIDVIVTMAALVIVPPKNPKPGLKFERKGDKIVFTNNGNVMAALLREDFCTEDKKICAPLEGKRIWPGVTWEVEVPAALKGKPFEQTVQISGKYSRLSFPPN